MSASVLFRDIDQPFTMTKHFAHRSISASHNGNSHSIGQCPRDVGLAHCARTIVPPPKKQACATPLPVGQIWATMVSILLASLRSLPNGAVVMLDKGWILCHALARAYNSHLATRAIRHTEDAPLLRGRHEASLQSNRQGRSDTKRLARVLPSKADIQNQRWL